MPGSNLTSIFEKIHAFWISYPAWYFATALLLGTALGLTPNLWLLIPFIAFFATLPKHLNSVLIGVLVILTTILYVGVSIKHPKELKSHPIELRFHIDSIQKKTLFHGYSWQYKGYASGTGFSNIPVFLSLPEREGLQRPLANKDYLVHGILKEYTPHSYHIKIDKEAPWVPLNYTWSLAEWRHTIKNHVIDYIQQNYTHPSVAKFLSGISTGLLDDRTLGADFSRFGLQHILAISGFHFALLVMLLQGLARAFLPIRTLPSLLIFIMTAYFIFLGPSPSIIRAWIACLCPLIGQLIHKPTNSLNILALGMIVVLIYEPQAVGQAGFQFSFTTTFCILVYLKPIDNWLTVALHKRSLSVASEMSRFNQWGYLISSYLRQALSLTLAVNLAVIPLSLMHFQQVPLLSFFYNLFFPLMVTLSMILFLIGTLIPFASPLHTYNNLYTKFMLNFTSEVPYAMDLHWKTDLFGTGITLSYFTLLLLLGFVIERRQRPLSLE